MLKIIFISLILMGSAFAQKLSLDQRRQKILEIVDEELAEVTRLAKQQDYKAPDTLLRVSELNLEKARLWREAENEKYLSIPPAERRKVNKNSYFKKSAGFFENANDSAAVVVKKFPKYKGIGDIYYILGFNNKELGNHEAAQKYFKLATQKAQAGTAIASKSKLALADYYFNANKYKEAVPLYEASINKVDERWWTKDAFNLAWSYYRVKNYDKAISLMKEIHKKSADSKYIDMRSVVERDIGVFFVDAGRMNDAIKFYESLGLNYTEQFVKIANLIVSQGRFAQAESLLSQAAKAEKDRSRKIAIYLAQLDLFDKYGKVAEHLEVSKTLVDMHISSPLSADQLKSLTYHVNKKAAELQKSTASDIYANVPKVKRVKSKQSIAYFELSSKLAPEQRAEKTFFQGETAYAAGNFSSALNYYISSFDSAKTSNNKKIVSQSLEGMLSSLGQSSLKPATAEKFYIPVYTRYLSVDSQSDKAKSIFVKLFNTQFDAKDMPAAEATLATFAEKFPKDYKTQEGMLAKIMEHYRGKKDYGKVKFYVEAINQGKYKVSNKYAEALRTLMTKIQIEGVQQSLDRGEKGVALKGYHQIYNSTDSTPKAKVNAAYNLSALYYELGDTNQSYQWGVIAARDMEVKDVSQLADSFLGISAGLFLKQHFAQSADLSHRLFVKLCKEKSSHKVTAFKNAVFIALANGDLDKSVQIKDQGASCDIPETVISDVSLEILKDLAKAKKWEMFEKTIVELEKNPKNHPNLIRPYEDLRREYLAVGQAEEARNVAAKQQRYFNEAKAKKADIPVDALDMMAERMLVSLKEKEKRLGSIELRFPETEFNNAVKAKLQILDQLTSEVTAIQKLGSGKGIVEAYQIVIEAYESFGESLKAFTPEGKAPEYVASFQKAMAQVYNPILNNAKTQRKEVKKLISENKVLATANYSVLYGRHESFKRFIPAKEAVLMDRGGVR